MKALQTDCRFPSPSFLLTPHNNNNNNCCTTTFPYSLSKPIVASFFTSSFFSLTSTFHSGRCAAGSAFSSPQQLFLRCSTSSSAASPLSTSHFTFTPSRGFATRRGKKKMPPKKQVKEEKILLGRPGNNLKSGIVSEISPSSHTQCEKNFNNKITIPHLLT